MCDSMCDSMCVIPLAVDLLMLCKDASLELVAHVAKCACLSADVASMHSDAVSTADILNNVILCRCVSSQVVLGCMWQCMIMLIASKLTLKRDSCTRS